MYLSEQRASLRYNYFHYYLIYLCMWLYNPYMLTPPLKLCAVPSRCSSLGASSTFVNRLAMLCSIGQYLREMLPLCITSQMKWNQISMCLVHEWYWSFFVTHIADWWSHLRVVGELSSCAISMMNMQIHRASFAAWVAAMYLASVVDYASIGCFFELHETAPPSTMKI